MKILAFEQELHATIASCNYWKASKLTRKLVHGIEYCALSPIAYRSIYYVIKYHRFFQSCIYVHRKFPTEYFNVKAKLGWLKFKILLNASDT